MLPPTVPQARTWMEPNRRSTSAMSGSIEPSTGSGACSETIGAERIAAGALLDAGKLGDAADVNDLFQRREFFGDPQPDVGRAGDDRGVGMLRIKLRQRLLARRRSKERAGIADEKIGLVVERVKRLQPRRGIAGEPIVGAAVADLERRVDDRPIAGAAAQIPRQHIVDFVAARAAVALVIVREQAHHDARRAKAALRAMQTRHRLLHRMQHAVFGEILDRDQFGAVELAEQRDARIDRLVSQAAIALAHDDDGAGAAIAFRAAFFGAGRSLLQTQPVQHGGARRKIRRAARVRPSLRNCRISGHDAA